MKNIFRFFDFMVFVLKKSAFRAKILIIFDTVECSLDIFMLLTSYNELLRILPLECSHDALVVEYFLRFLKFFPI